MNTRLLGPPEPARRCQGRLECRLRPIGGGDGIPCPLAVKFDQAQSSGTWSHLVPLAPTKSTSSTKSLFPLILHFDDEEEEEGLVTISKGSALVQTATGKNT